LRRDELYLEDICESADAIATFITDVDSESFKNNDLLRSAVLQKLTIIGEATARISSDLKGRYPEIPWSEIIAFRNIAVHTYFDVDWSIVWNTATRDVPSLRQQIATVLALEFP